MLVFLSAPALSERKREKNVLKLYMLEVSKVHDLLQRIEDQADFSGGGQVSGLEEWWGCARGQVNTVGGPRLSTYSVEWCVYTLWQWEESVIPLLSLRVDNIAN